MMEMDILAHEIINPLNIIVGCAELSIIELNNDKEKLLQYLDTIKQQSLICCNLLQEQIKEIKESKTLFKSINIINLINKLIVSFKNNPLIISKKISFEINNEINNNNNTIKLYNESYLKIILNNILLNSIKYAKSNSFIKIMITKQKNINNIYYNNDTSKDNINIKIINNFNNEEYIENSKLLDNDNLNFKKCNKLGLNIVDKLILSLNGEWSIIQKDNLIITDISIPQNI